MPAAKGLPHCCCTTAMFWFFRLGGGAHPETLAAPCRPFGVSTSSPCTASIAWTSLPAAREAHPLTRHGDPLLPAMLTVLFTAFIGAGCAFHWMLTVLCTASQAYTHGWQTGGRTWTRVRTLRHGRCGRNWKECRRVTKRVTMS